MSLAPTKSLMDLLLQHVVPTNARSAMPAAREEELVPALKLEQVKSKARELERFLGVKDCGNRNSPRPFGGH
jgi:hypothetical protein